jgi:hypothetical protein
MTALQLRIKYKFETGFTPTLGMDSSKTQEFYNYQGELTNEYVQWLEGNATHWREKYKKDTGHYAVIQDYYSIDYTDGYKEWLEDRRVKGYTLMQEITKWGI